ncbi:MAG: opacity protein-like surface antigen [Salibacteraceae bacterium]|jgi:opacity protein-like surface antigen
MKKLQLFIIGAILSISMNAQDNFFGITYNTAMPMGESADFIDNYSWGAMGLEWKKMTTDNLSIGVNLSWQIFSQKVDFGTIEIPDSRLVVTGTQLRYFNYFPMTATASYHFNPQGKIIPFVGAGAGLYRVLQRFDISGFTYNQDSWNFGFYPEVGVLIPTGGSADFFVNSKYHYILPSNGYQSHSYLNVNIGFSYFY